jgi:hypothetical protein
MEWTEILKHKNEIFGGRASKQVIKAIYDLHISVYKREFKVGCSSCYADCFVKLNNHFKMKENTGSNYTLHSGAIVLTTRDGSKVMTNKNITDALAEEILFQNKGLIKYFRRHPQDWEIRCGLKKPVVVDAEELTEEVERTNDVDEVIEDAFIPKKRKGKK